MRMQTQTMAGRFGALLLMGAAALPALAFRAQEGRELFQAAPAPAEQDGQAPEPGIRQRAAAEAASRAGVNVTWHSKRSTPSSVRGEDLGRRQAFSGGKGLALKGGGAYAEDAIAVLDNLSEIFAIRDASQEFKVRRVESDRLGCRHVRIDQTYRRLRVAGGELLVHFNARGTAYQVNGQYVPGLSLDVRPAITGDQAVEQALADLAALLQVNGAVSAGPELVVLARGLAEPRLAYELVLKAAPGSGVWHYWIDALQGGVLVRYDGVRHIAAPTTNGAVVPLTGNLLPREGGGLVDVDGWRQNTGVYYMYNTNNNWLILNAAPSGYPDANTYAFRMTNYWGATDRAEMSAAYNADKIQEYFRVVLGRNSYDDAGTIAYSYVHELDDFGRPMANAYWDGTAMHFGDGDGATADNLAVVDVFAHEYSHAVTEHTANLIYMNESGALNESFSDIFGCCAEFYAQPDDRGSYPDANAGLADWLMGEDCWLASPALRDMRAPGNTEVVGEGGEQPSKYKGTHWYSGMGDNGGVHINSGVQNFFFYLLCDGGEGVNDGVPYKVTGIGVTNAEQVAYRTLSVYCTMDTDYEAAVDAWLSAAEDLNPEWVPSVRRAWNAVMGIPPPILFSPSELPPGRVGTPYSYTLGVVGGEQPFVWELADGTLPPDLTFDNGLISGMPEAEGTSSFLVVLTDDVGITVSNRYTLTILPPFAAPLAEGFEHGGAMPDSWTQESPSGLLWTFSNGGPYSHPPAAHGGAYNALLRITAPGSRLSRLITPRIDFGENPRAARLTFWHNMDTWVSGQDELRVYAKSTWDEEWTLLATYVTQVSQWTQRTLELPNPSRTYYVAFEGTAKYGYGVCVDDVQIWDPTPPLGITSPSPLPPATTEQPYAYTLAAEGGVAPYTFEVVSGELPAGFILSPEGELTGLSDQVQSEEFIVQLTDSEGDTAIKVFQFEVVLPRADFFVEDFEQGGLMPPGWTQEFVTNQIPWLFQQGGRFGQHPTAAASGSYNAFLWSGAWVNGGSFDQKTRLITPRIDLGQAPANVRLTFWHYMENWDSGQDELRLFYRTTPTGPWVPLATYTQSTPAWTQRAIVLPNPSSTYYLAFEGNALFGYGVCVDNIRISDDADAPLITTSMALPNGVVGYTYSTALSAVGGAEPYTWSLVSNALPSGLTLSSAGVISGTPDTAGRVFFRASVMSGDGSGKASTNLFSLRVTAPGPLPYSEPFENGGALPFGWTQENLLGTVSWTFRSGSPVSGGAPSAPHGGAYNACFFFNSQTVNDLRITRLVSPALNLGVGTPNTRLTFWHCMASYYGFQDSLRVLYKTSLEGAWTEIARYEVNTPGWTERTVDLPNPSPTYYIAFEGWARYGCGVCIDDVLVTGDIEPTYDSWKSANFTSEELAAGDITGDWDDPDFDTIPNGLEYAMGLDPKVPDTEGLPTGGVEDGHLIYSYRENKEATDVTFVVEACTSLALQDWTTNGVSQISRDDSNAWWQVTSQHDVPISSAPQRFLRLKVFLP